MARARNRPKTDAVSLTFLGTRGEIDIRSRRHRLHSALLIEHDNSRIMLDCGADWRGRLSDLAPTAILVTHAHPDHAAGLSKGAPCPVHATEQTLELLRSFPIRDRRTIRPNKRVAIGGVQFTAYPVLHSIRAPAVGYRVATNGVCFFYLPDVAVLPDPAEALAGVDFYVGDGATLTRSMVRSRNGTMIGHASIRAQLGWCKMAGVPRAIFTHCGSPLVRARARELNARLGELSREHGIEVLVASDGDQLSFPASRRQRPPPRLGAA